MGLSRAKPSSAPHTSPISSIRSATPTRRVSPPPSKPSTPAPRSASPTPRRVSTGSSASAGTGVRGMSPQKARRGTSASPKIKAWQANIPGFSCDVPPNLRTSLDDRSASYTRGSSPASRNGRDSSSKVNRQSMSPTATRSVSSSYSHDRDWFSSHSKGSISSSADNDVDSLQSVTVGSVDQLIPRKVGMYSNNNRSLAYSRRSPKMSASAPKRSFDSVTRQMDNRKAPQNMFRPLLSSVPSTTYYVGKSSTNSIMSRNSSATTSSNTSSDQGTGFLPDPEGNYYSQDDRIGESGKMLCHDIEEEVFSFDKDGEELGCELYGDIDRSHLTEGHPVDSDDIEVSASHEPSQVDNDISEVDDLGSTVLCSLCSCSFDATDLAEMELKLCPECRLKGNFLDAITPETLAVAADKPPVTSTSTPEECRDLDSLAAVVSGSLQVAEMDELKGNRTQSWDDSPLVSHVEVQEENVANGEGEEPTGGRSPPGGGTGSQESEHFYDHPNTKITTAEGAGISVLLKRSSSTKGLVVQGRACTAVTILPYDDLSYARETTTSIRSSIGHGSFSSSSSIDPSSSRQTETRMQRQFSGKRSDIENYRYEVKSQSVGSSHTGISSHSHQTMGLAMATSEVNFESSVGDMNNNPNAETAVASVEHLSGLEIVGAELANSLSNQFALLEEDDSEHGESGEKVDASALQLSGHNADAGMEDDLLACHDDFRETSKLENCEDLQENARNETDLKASTAMQNAMSDTCVSVLDEMSAPLKRSINGSLVSTSEIEKDASASTPEPISSDPVVDILGESTVTMESHGRTRTRSLTLEEATDTILFCSSIVHDLAYGAATVAMEKEKEKEREALEALEGFRPTVTIVDKSTSSDKKDPRSGRIISKRGLKPHTKARQKRIDSDKKSPSSKPENDENIDESLTRNVGLPHKFDSTKPPKLESKCNCTIM
ncbi:hypothetical protein CDL15_Pgr024487 [Punica granatum]|uniref:Uncharacterized protein n=1 Tax=Punica granatum TaxID=22663 RepID=A0A218XYR5_PUNGR|nr:hypothetical protein CDL15_Pgr024487 [Punica granatum]